MPLARAKDPDLTSEHNDALAALTTLKVPAAEAKELFKEG
jgi:hypothetical protein